MKEIADLLRELAIEFGTTVEMLWPMLVAQTRYDWIGQVAVALFLATVGTIGFVITFKNFNRWDISLGEKRAAYQQADEILDAYGCGQHKIAEEKFGYSCDEAAKRRTDTKAARDTCEGGVVKFIVAFILFGLMATSGWIIFLHSLTDISQFLVPEAATLENIIRMLR